MTGLFATLVDAAQGHAPAAQPPPRARFAPPAAEVTDIAWLEMPAEPNMPAANGARVRDTAGVDSGRDDESTAWAGASAAPQEAHGAAADASGRIGRRAGLRASFPADAPRAAPPLLPTASSPLTDRVAQGGEGAATPSAQTAIVPPTTGRQAAGNGAAARTLPPDRSTVFEPLLDRPRQVAPADRTVPRATPAEADAVGLGLVLRIGRIEVRPPGPHTLPASPRSSTAATTRPLALPRAAVRQSLDEFRAGRKR